MQILFNSPALIKSGFHKVESLLNIFILQFYIKFSWIKYYSHLEKNSVIVRRPTKIPQCNYISK